MKRLLSLTLTLIISLTALAVSPNLACEKIFDRNDLKTKGYQVVKIEQPNNVFRSVTAENDKKLQKEIEKAIEKDRTKAFNVIDSYDNSNNQDCTILNINSNGKLISVGFFRNDKGYVNLFIQGEPEAFK